MSDENLLTNHLLRSGTTPSFAFPLDVAEFRGEGGVMNYGTFQSRVWPKMGTDLKMALSVYSPGKILTVDGEDYKVEGLYIYGAEDPINRAQSHFSEKIDENEKLRYYNRCRAPLCGWVSKDMDKPSDLSVCPVCEAQEIDYNGEKVPAIKTDVWYRPDGFAPRIVPWQDDESLQDERSWSNKMAPKMVSKKENIEPSGGVELPAPLTNENETQLKDYNFDEIISKEDLDPENEKLLEGVFDRINLRSTRDDGEGIELILINSGYRGSGYYICTDCGAIEPRKDLFDRIQSPGSTMVGHHRPYAAIDDGKVYRKLCNGSAFEEGVFDTVYLGMTFWTDMLIISIPGKRPISADPSIIKNIELDRGLRTLKEALITEIQKSAKLVNREIKGGIRKRSVFEEIDGEMEQLYYYDIYLYDDVSGGAGLSSSILTRENAWSNFLQILKSTEKRLSGDKCLGGNGCDRACLGCLLDFRNKNEHGTFDRKQGLRIIRYILHGLVPTIESGEEEDSKEYISIIKNSINQNLERINPEEPVKVKVENGCLVAEKNGNRLFLRPLISFTEKNQDPVIAEWRRNREKYLEFGETLKFSDDSHKIYSYQNLERIVKNPIWLSTQIDRILNPGSL